MCKEAAKTGAVILATAKPFLTQLFTLENVPEATQTTILNAYTAAETALTNWVPGTPATEVTQLLNDFTTVLTALPVPETDVELVDLIVGIVTGVIGVLTANEPQTPTVQSAAKVAKETTTAIKIKVPELKKINLRKPEEAVTQANEIWAAKVAKLHPAETPETVLDAAQTAHEEAAV